MNKRTDQKNKRSLKYKDLLMKTAGILFCVALLVFLLNAADMSTRRMIMCNDDKYALAASLQEDSMLRLDIAGEKYLLNVEPVIRITDGIVIKSKSYYEGLVKTIKAKTGI